MYYVYLLRSTLRNWVYVGITKNVDQRVNEHNEGFVKSTKHYKPYKLIFAQMFLNRRDARDLEKFLKISWNKESLLHLLNI
ncbi:GIY-YIG nuclease family protein [Candidatus Jorgensenbacteria bacterium]|nr:GIY-YIG nuclease family protein [Candidatus Jorgensenbacteria bacterium]